MSQLVVYRASAGSGKTFRLAAEYIKQLIVKPDSYKNILAVTFTNKATAEMKGRILNELFALSKGEDTAMGETISKELNVSKENLKSQAKLALSLLLHDYSRFSVSTIDSFVQRVIQALLWEIGQQGGVDIELDTTPVLEHAADNLMDSASELDDLLKWLTTMGNSLMEDGKSWDVRYKLIELGKQLFSEKFRLMNREDIDKLGDKERVNEVKNKLQDIIRSTVIDLNKLANDALNELERKGIDADSFANKSSGVIGFFTKCSSYDESTREFPNYQSSYVQKALNDPSGESWVTKTTFNNKLEFAPLEAVVKDILHPTLQKIIKTFEERKTHYFTAKQILKNLENLALIGDLWSKVRELSREEGFLLLSDSSHLLKEFVKDTDAPFIYEKVGTRYDVFMIDEFQDTSEVQWHNFKPLIENSLSQGHFSMIVGDVKQSIYRWRNGDWSILANGVENDFKHLGVNSIPLDINRRSLTEIINFNNLFFSKAKDVVKESIAISSADADDLLVESMKSEVDKAYADISQKSPTETTTSKGYVEINLFDFEKKADCDGIIAKELPNLIEKIRLNHNLGDIAILVRSNKEGQQVADILLEHNRNEQNNEKHIHFVSQEGLKLNSSVAVRLIISAFRLVQNPSNQIAKRELAKEIAYLNINDKQNWHKYFVEPIVEEDEEWLRSLNTRPLQEVFEAVVGKYKLNEVSGELAHLSELNEHITVLSSKGSVDVNRFLEWWDSKVGNLSLTVPESSNAISILTIHKSKGLQFPVVIIPYANWSLGKQGSQPILWVESNEKPFDILPKYPISPNKETLQTLFAKDKMEEDMKVFVDNLNLLYVAFTRPEKELYIFVPKKKTKNEKDEHKISEVGKLISETLKTFGIQPTFSNESEGSVTYSFGERYQPPIEGRKTKAPTSTWTISSYPVGKPLRGVKLKLEAEEFFLSTPKKRFAPLEHGKLMHELFSLITTIDDVESAIKKLILNGLLDASEEEELSRSIKHWLSQEPFSDWFSGQWQIFNERSILTPQGYHYRPDRVMHRDGKTIVVDFKFGAEQSSHLKQVGQYVKLLTDMGYQLPLGYVWYVDQNNLVKV